MTLKCHRLRGYDTPCASFTYMYVYKYMFSSFLGENHHTSCRFGTTAEADRHALADVLSVLGDSNVLRDGHDTLRSSAVPRRDADLEPPGGAEEVWVQSVGLGCLLPDHGRWLQDLLWCTAFGAHGEGGADHFEIGPQRSVPTVETFVRNERYCPPGRNCLRPPSCRKF